MMRRVYIGRLSHHVRERDVERFFRSEGKIREVLMKDGYAFVEFDHTEDAEAAVRRLNGRDINGDRVHVEFAKGAPRGREGVRNMGSFGRGPIRNGPPRRDFRNDRGRDRGDNHGRDGARDRISGGGGGGGGAAGAGISYAEKYGPPRNTDFRVIVENLSSRVSWQDLKDLMRQAGDVTFADAHKRERNMGIVDFASHKDMKHAIDTLNDTRFHGRRIKVYEDTSRRHGGRGGRDNQRRQSRSRSRSISRSRSRSRSKSRSISKSRSPSKSRSGSGSITKSRSRSVSRSPSIAGARSRSRSRSAESPENARSQTRSRSSSRESQHSEQRNHSKTPTPNGEETS